MNTRQFTLDQTSQTTKVKHRFRVCRSSQTTLHSDLKLDEAARVVAVGLQRVLLIQGPQDRVGFIAEGLSIQAAEVKTQIIQ